MIVVLLRWWYTTGWMQVIHTVGSSITRIERTFSVILLLKTLFAPWRRIISIGSGGIDAKLRAVFDNIVSRCIGGVVRLMVVLCAAVLILVCLVGGVLLALVWPLLPLAAVFFALRSITG